MGRVTAAAAMIVLTAGAAQAQEAPAEAPAPAETPTPAAPAPAAPAPAPEAGETAEADVLVITGEPLEGYAVESNTTGRTEGKTFEQPNFVSAVPYSVMLDQAADDLWDVLHNVSGVSVENVGGYAGPNDTMFLRGFRSREMYYNGMLVEAIPSVNLASLERVEYLKGPSSVLYGLIEPGGVVNLVSRAPQATPHYQLRGRFGSHDYTEASADVGGPIVGEGDRALRYRINGGYRHNASFRDYVEDDRYWVQPALAWSPIEGTRVSVELSHSAQNRDIDEGISFNAQFEPVADIDTFLGERGMPGQQYEHTMLFARVEQDITDLFTFRSSFLGRHWENDMYGIRRSRPVANEDNTVVRLFENSDFAMDSYNWVNEGILKLALGPTEHELLVGVDWRTRTTALEVKRGGVGPIDLIDPVYSAMPDPEEFSLTEIEQNMDWVSGFAREKMTLFDDLHITVAGRYDSITQDSENVDDPESRQDKEETALTGQAGILYALPDFAGQRVAIFADYSQSFYPTAPGQLDRDGNQLDAETGEQYEAGIKLSLLGGQLSGTLAWYDLEKSNIAIQDPEVEGAVQNAGRLGISGIEVDIAGSPLPGLELIASYTMADSEVIESDSLEVGNRFRNQAEHMYSFWARYSLRSGPLAGFGLGAGLFGSTDRPGDDQNQFDLDGYTRIDAAAYYVRTLSSGPTLRAQINVENVADSEYYESSLASTRVFPGAPRSVDFTLVATF